MTDEKLPIFDLLVTGDQWPLYDSLLTNNYASSVNQFDQLKILITITLQDNFSWAFF